MDDVLVKIVGKMTLFKSRSIFRSCYVKKNRSTWQYARLISVIILMFVCFNILLGRQENEFVDETHASMANTSHSLSRRARDKHSLDATNKTYPEIELGQNFIMNIGSRIINNFTFEFVINDVNACKRSPKLVIFVISAANHHERREAIRLTWADPDRLQTISNIILFIVAVHNNQTQRQIETESETFHDILQPDFAESYRNLPLKSVAILKWCRNYCMSSKFVLKVDDDVYVNIPVLLQLLQTQPQSDFILGKENFHEKVRRNPKDRYYVSENEYPYSFFPPYLQGVGYVITTHALPRLYDAARRIPLTRLEDVYVTGFCRIHSGVSLVHTDLFKTGHKPIRCVVRFLALAHGYGRISKLLKMHVQVSNTALLCPPPNIV